MGPT
ncbi:hypothetical protein NQ318_013376 [Aromia moschata]